MAKKPTPKRWRSALWPRKRQKILRISVLSVLLTGFAVLCFGALPQFLLLDKIPVTRSDPPESAPMQPNEELSSFSEPEPEPIVETVSFSATGDNLIHSPIYRQAANRAGSAGGYDFDFCYAHIVPLYAKQDVNWINQETLCSDTLEPSTYPRFSTPGDCARSLYRAGIRVFSLANNHTYDKGASGIAATLQFWDSMPEDVVTTGLWRGEADYDRIPLQTINGVTIAYLSYTEHTNGIQQSKAMPANVIYTSQTDVLRHQIQLARQQADFVVVGVHWGIEDSHTITNNQRFLAQQLADWGADVIIGTHPHVLQDAQWLTAEDGRQSFVAYSLGNFLSTQNHPDQLVGAILTLQLQKTTQSDGTVQCAVLAPQLHPTVTHYGTGKSNVRAYLLCDYTQELAQKHGVRENYSHFSLDSAKKIAQNNISADFLALAAF